jgi:hypothetical protein
VFTYKLHAYYMQVGWEPRKSPVIVTLSANRRA